MAGPPAKEAKYPFLSRYGSHSDMIDQEKTSELLDTNYVVLKDEWGFYKTIRNRLDNGLADETRFKESRLNKLFERSRKEK